MVFTASGREGLSGIGGKSDLRLQHIGAIIVGLILGVLAKLVMPGKQRVPLWLTILVGIVAAIIGNYVATLLGVAETFGFDWTRHGLQLLFAVIGIGALSGAYARKV